MQFCPGVGGSTPDRTVTASTSGPSGGDATRQHKKGFQTEVVHDAKQVPEQAAVKDNVSSATKTSHIRHHPAQVRKILKDLDTKRLSSEKWTKLWLVRYTNGEESESA